MNCAEFIDIVKSGQPIILRRRSKEYIRLTENSLSVISKAGAHICLWLAANRKFKHILRSVSFDDTRWKIDTFRMLGDDIRVQETSHFLHQWQEIREARAWSNQNFPGFNEIATFVYMTLIPEYWTIYLEREGEPVEEALPLVEHESMHADTSGYDA